MADRKTKRGKFGAYLDFGLPKGADVVVVCENNGSGLTPLRVCLQHQVYEKDIAGRKGVTIIPIRSSEYIHVPDEEVRDAEASTD